MRRFVLLAALLRCGYYLYGELSVVIRAAGVVVLIAAALGVAAATATQRYKSCDHFAKESRMEIRKVVLIPTPSLIQTTLIV